MVQFDSDKELENKAAHDGLSLAFGAKILADPHVIEALDDRFNYGEERWNILGMVEGRVYAATYTERDGDERFISVRGATKKEANTYFRLRG